MGASCKRAAKARGARAAQWPPRLLREGRAHAFAGAGRGRVLGAHPSGPRGEGSGVKGEGAIAFGGGYTLSDAGRELLREEGLDCCFQEAWAVYSPQIREVVDIPEDHIFFCGMAIGYRDTEAPVNNFDVKRAGTDESVRWEGWQ